MSRNHIPVANHVHSFSALQGVTQEICRHDRYIVLQELTFKIMKSEVSKKAEPIGYIKIPLYPLTHNQIIAGTYPLSLVSSEHFFAGLSLQIALHIYTKSHLFFRNIAISHLVLSMFRTKDAYDNTHLVTAHVSDSFRIKLLTCVDMRSGVLFKNFFIEMSDLSMDTALSNKW